jgi:hypothetical protein
MILPWLVLALLLPAQYARMMRGNLIETMGQDYIRTARVKGLPEWKVILKHGVRASLTPMVTLIGLDLGALLGGAVITETVFNLQGVGQWAAISVSQGRPAGGVGGDGGGHARRDTDEPARRYPLRLSRPQGELLDRPAQARE